ncbi:MAG: ABC transporter substrate-binding protein [Caldilineaceae bacterium]|nr:ABC transporter substrate-binding protein [Caldilineaceae bacterium]MDE0182187.1 ABC transporter substrate-binding protein [Caldilineaceae bacterium]
MIHRRAWRFVALVVVLAVALAGCVPVQPAAMGDEMAPKEVTIAVGIEPVSLDAWRSFGETGAAGFRNALEQLVARDYVNGGFLPMLATSWERLDDTTIRFNLREGVSFHDGSPFNAEGAAISINHTFDPDNAFDLLDFLGPVSAAAVDEYTLDVSTPEPDPILLGKVEWVAISSARQLTEDPDSYHSQIIGTGPYQFVEWRKGESISYEANPDWWGLDNPDDAGGAQTYQKATYRFLQESQVRVAAVQAGEVDLAQFVTPEQCQALDAGDDTSCESAPSVETIFIRMDTNSPLLSDRRARLAFQMAIDKASIVDNILGGAATVAGQIVNSSATGHDPSLEPYPYDPDQARELLAAAAADGVPTDMEITLGARHAVFPRSDEVLQAVEAMLEEVGFSVTTTFYDPEGFGQVMLVNIKDVPEDRNFVAIHLHGNEIMDYASSFRFYYSCEGILSVYCNEEADAVWMEALPLSGDEREMKLQELNRIVHEDVAIGYIGHVDLSYGVGSSLSWAPKLDHRIIVKEMTAK